MTFCFIMRLINTLTYLLIWSIGNCILCIGCRSASAYNTNCVFWCFIWCHSWICSKLHHQSAYTDINYAGVVISSFCRQPHCQHPSDAIVHSRSLVHMPEMHFRPTFVMHKVWILFRSISNHTCFLLLTICTYSTCFSILYNVFMYWYH